MTLLTCIMSWKYIVFDIGSIPLRIALGIINFIFTVNLLLAFILQAIDKDLATKKKLTQIVIEVNKENRLYKVNFFKIIKKSKNIISSPYLESDHDSFMEGSLRKRNSQASIMSDEKMRGNKWNKF